MAGWVVEQEFHWNFLVHFTDFCVFCGHNYGWNTGLNTGQLVTSKRGKCPGDEVDIIAKKDWELEGTNIQDGAHRYVVSSSML